MILYQLWKGNLRPGAVRATILLSPLLPLNGGDGCLQVMDFEVGDRIQFCGCASIRIEQKGRNAWIVKSNDVKAVLRGVDADGLELDFTQGLIAFAADS